MQSTDPIVNPGEFPLSEFIKHADFVDQENVLARALEAQQEAAQRATVEEAERIAAEVMAKNAMAQGAIGETVQNVAEAPVAAQAAEKTPAAAHVSEQTYRKNLESVSELNTMTLEKAANQLFATGLTLKRMRESSTITTANNPNPNDFERAA